jgi:hypothetical protein
MKLSAHTHNYSFIAINSNKLQTINIWKIETTLNIEFWSKVK